MSKIRSKISSTELKSRFSQRNIKTLSFFVDNTSVIATVYPTAKSPYFIKHVVAFILITSFFMQGVVSVSADVEQPTNLEQNLANDVNVVSVSSAEDENIVVPDTSPNVDSPEVATTISTELEEDEDVFLSVDSLLQSEESAESADPITANDTTNESIETVEPIDAHASSSDTDNDTTADEYIDDVGTQDEVLEEISSSSNEYIETTGEEALVAVTYNDAEVVFNKQSCTELASGSFYCQETDQANTLSDTLFSAPDEDGDLEIYLVRDGEQFKVTDNQVDDAAPFFDQNTNSLVWHRMLNDRFQIISYDVESGVEVQITNTSTNNMEPNRQGEYTVWQRWEGTNWDIILLNNGEEKVISSSQAHDIAPYIHGSLVVWNRYSQTEEKTIEIYDIKNDTYVTVDDPEGMSVTNPRMVFVYDSLHPNGDIVTKGYDVLARKFIDLGTLPRPLPENIPHSDSTGETRALIQNKPVIKSDIEEVFLEPEIGDGPEPEPTDQNENQSATASDFTLDLSENSSSPETAQITTESVITEFDLVIPPLAPQEPDVTD